MTNVIPIKMCARHETWKWCNLMVSNLIRCSETFGNPSNFYNGHNLLLAEEANNYTEYKARKDWFSILSLVKFKLRNEVMVNSRFIMYL